MKLGKKTKITVITLAILAVTYTAYAQVLSSQFTEIQDVVCTLLKQFYYVLVYLASAIGAILITVYSMMWIVSADTSAKTGAKTALLHIILGLFIISMALLIVNAVFPSNDSCIADWEAITPPTS